VHNLVGQLGTQKNETHLWPVTVSDNHFPTLLHHAGNVGTGFSRSFKLISHSLMILIFDQRVAADGHNCRFPPQLPFSYCPGITYTESKSSYKYEARFKTRAG
jgi:hypothetical protein